MFNALSDFLIYCRVERRLSEMTCKAYERDVRACLEFLRAGGLASLAEAAKASSNAEFRALGDSRRYGD